ncbi:ABC transporter ATP-binding protein [Sulfuracidifex metallicus]|uniref:ABC transporter ATP-binding protein n=1 Tax=Sulfuracidifex metallicus TaxID=47303 RepID=UPI0022723950|nr:ABC transporter ATP-binding protein [Sulfuracidifex metallicus]MCY0850495.1 ABC transporter ATP-binding protein [Sulfuracidifex metallicus]
MVLTLIKGLNVNLQGKRILNGISVTFVRGLNVILGPNGSGKTTLLRSIIGMIKYEGEIQVEGKIGYSPAEFFPSPMRVIDVMMSGTNLKREDYMEYLKLGGMERYELRQFSTLSSGEKRMILILKAFAEGDTVIMDEPLSNLDARNQVRVMKMMRDSEKVVIATSHDVELATLARQVILIKNGNVIDQGEPSMILTEEKVSSLYDVKVKRISLGERIIFVKELIDL